MVLWNVSSLLLNLSILTKENSKTNKVFVITTYSKDIVNLNSRNKDIEEGGIGGGDGKAPICRYRT